MPKFETLPGERSASLISSIINLGLSAVRRMHDGISMQRKMPKKLVA